MPEPYGRSTVPGDGGRDMAYGGGSSGSGFSTYLRELHAQSAPPNKDVESRVVNALADGVSKDIPRQLSDSDCLPLSDLLRALDSLQEYGLVHREGDRGHELFCLSPTGMRTSQAMGFSRTDR